MEFGIDKGVNYIHMIINKNLSKMIVALYFSMSFLITIGCNRTVNETLPEETTTVIEDCFLGHYYNSYTHSSLKSIEITKEENKYLIRIFQIDSISAYTGGLLKNELVILLENDNELHMYKNHKELRVYNVVRNGYQPEDVEWTLYQ